MSRLTSMRRDEAAPSEALEPVVRLRAIAKTFGGTKAVDAVDLDLFPGEVHALVGENGAGKSTLMRVLAGFFPNTAARSRSAVRACA